MATEIETRKKIRSAIDALKNRSLNSNDLLTELTKIIYTYSSISTEIKGNDYLQLNISISHLRQKGYSVKNIFKAILPKSVSFQQYWINEMKDLIKEFSISN